MIPSNTKSCCEFLFATAFCDESMWLTPLTNYTFCFQFAPVCKGARYVLNIGALIGGIGFLYFAIMDGAGEQEHLPKHYRGDKSLRKWQMKWVYGDIISCIGNWIIFFSFDKSWGFYIIGCVLLLIGLILIYIFRKGFEKNIENKAS